MSTQFFQCPRCKAANAIGTRFCSNCGLPFQQPAAPASIPTPKKSNSLLITLGVLFGVFGLCALCGIIGNLNNKNSNSKVAIKSDGSNSDANTQPVVAPSPTATPKPAFVELQQQGEALLELKKDEYVRDDLKEFDAVMQPLREIPKEAKEYRQAQALNKKLIDKSARIGAELLVLGPKPKSSEWDGRVDAVVKYLRRNLNDYDSSEFVEWSPVTKLEVKGEPFWVVRLKLRAKNAFGGYILKDTYYFIRQNEVVAAEGL